MSSVLKFAEWTREQKEEYAKQRMLEMQLKNARMKQRHAEVEQDRIQAENHNCAITNSSKVSKTGKICDEQDSVKNEKKMDHIREWDWGKPDIEHWDSPKYHTSYMDYRSSRYDRYSDRRNNCFRNERSDHHIKNSHNEKRYSLRNDSRHKKTFYRKNDSQFKKIDQRRNYFHHEKTDSHHEKTDSHQSDSFYENTNHNRSEQKSGSRKIKYSQSHRKHDSDENNKICSTNVSCTSKRSKEVENHESSQNYSDKMTEKHNFQVLTSDKDIHSLPFISESINLDNKKSVSNGNALGNLWENNTFNQELDIEYRIESWVDNVNKSKKWMKEKSPFQPKSKLPDKPYVKFDRFECNFSHSSSDSESLKDFNIGSKEISIVSCSSIPSERQFSDNMQSNQQENIVEHITKHHPGKKITLNHICNLADKNNNESNNEAIMKNQDRYNDQKFNKYQLQYKQKSYDAHSNKRIGNYNYYSDDPNMHKDITCIRNMDEWKDEQTHDIFEKTSVLPTKAKQYIWQSCSMQKIEKHLNSDKYGKLVKNECKDDGIWGDYKQTLCNTWEDYEWNVQTQIMNEECYVQNITENEKQPHDRMQNSVKHSSKDHKHNKQGESDNEGIWGDCDQTSCNECIHFKQSPKSWKKGHSSMQKIRENIKQSCHNLQKSAKYDYNDKQRKVKQFDSDDTWKNYNKTSQTWGKLPQSSGQKAKEFVKPTHKKMQKNKNEESKYNDTKFDDDGIWGNIDQSDIIPCNKSTDAKDHKYHIKVSCSTSKNRSIHLDNVNKEYFKDEQESKTLQECEKHSIVSDDGGWCTMSEESDQDTKKNKIGNSIHENDIICSSELANQEQKW